VPNPNRFHTFIYSSSMFNTCDNVFHSALLFVGYETMASKLPIVKAKAVEASKFLTKNGCAYYKQMLEQNKQYIQEPPTVEKCQHLAKQVFYTRLARFVIHHFYPFNVQIL